ncbi:magnesium transporter [Sediminihaliea albiluteola]|nr:magnesium transporter [Sediminihaliea albiluteola]
MTENSEVAQLRDSIEQLPSGEAANRLRAEPKHIAQAVLDQLPATKASELAALMEFILPAGSPSEQEVSQQEDSAEASKQVEGSVADLLLEPFGVMGPDTTVAGALDRLVHTDPVNGITYIYVVDDERHLLGVVAMRDLLLGRPGQTLADIMTREPFCLSPDSPLSQAIRAALEHRHRLYPVTDEDNKLLGMVYGWQLFESMATELSAQSGSMVGVDREERLGTSIFQAFRMRHPWLQVNLLTAFCAALVVGIFEDTIAQIVALAVFLPVLAGQSGNTGCQALAITLRGMTLGELAEFPVKRLLRKELTLGAMNGFFVGLVAAAAMWVYATMTDAGQPLMLGLSILIAMVGACMGSGVFGVLVPLTLRRFGADPAMASSIFLTTFTDILGMGLMLFLATAMVL